MLRIGQGFDVHQLVENRKLILCGVSIPYEKGLLGHSDADVAIHALMDALLGALALGDIGKHFPDRDPVYQNADSMKLLAEVFLKIQPCVIHNVDLTIIAERPKVAPYLPLMRQNIATILQIAVDQVSIKATTTEQLGFCGRGEGIAAQAIALLEQGKS